MKREFEINLINNETYFNEFFDSAVSSLEKIENYKNVLFNRLNNALTLRVNKLCNLKSRINRINQILATYPAINKAITIKSKFHYPTKDHSYYTPIAYVENNDNIVNFFNKQNFEIINKNIQHKNETLGNFRNNEKNMTVYERYLETLSKYNDVAQELNNILLNTGFNAKNDEIMKEIDPIVNYVPKRSSSFKCC